MGAMKQIATELAERGITFNEDGSVTVATDQITVHVTRSLRGDNAPYIIVDTHAPGRLQIDVNDGTIWDQDPEEDVPAMLDGYAVIGEENVLLCMGCGERVKFDEFKLTLRSYVAAAQAHTNERNCKEKP